LLTLTEKVTTSKRQHVCPVDEIPQRLTTAGSIINLMSITVERYLKVVHPFWSKRNLKQWMIYAAMVFAWIGGPLSTAPVVFVSTIVQDGICLAYFVWESDTVRLNIHAWNLISFYFVPVIVFVFCYGRIVVVMRRQIRVMASHNVDGSVQASASEVHSKRMKWNVVKTMIIVSVAFLVCWFPSTFYFIIVNSKGQCQVHAMEESTRMAEDRDKWRKYVNSATNPRIEDG